MKLQANYDKFPSTTIEGDIYVGWKLIIEQLKTAVSQSGKQRFVLAVDCYTGVYHNELIAAFQQLEPELFVNTNEAFLPEDKVRDLTRLFITDDVLFGFLASFGLSDFFDKQKLVLLQERIAQQQGLIIVYGTGAALVAPEADLLVYADMARWEIQQRFRRKEVNGLGVNNATEVPSLQYKRGYFVDWKTLDKHKKQLFTKAAYWLDTNTKDNPKMIPTPVMLAGLEKTAKRPFRAMPFFDPAPWGGQWMKEVCDLDRSVSNYGWCFDCVLEENSLLLNVQGELFQIPANNLVFYKTRDLLGGPVEARFGQDFPIRFDFLDTMGGGNLSLQVHPTTQYIRDKFGVYYTQDESYYLVDAEPDATVYLGVKTGINPAYMIADLKKAQLGELVFDAEKYTNKLPAKKHDHFLIPGGTVHCSGANAMVLEISATPNLFTFKLWDWGRLGLDGKPRPINIDHGANVIAWERNTEYVQKYLVNHIEKIAEGDGWLEERTGLHENEFIETRRHWFSKPVEHNTNGGVQVLNLVEGREAVVESPDNAFEPFVVHYAETFIIPASVGRYIIKPYGDSEGTTCATIKAYVRF